MQTSVYRSLGAISIAAALYLVTGCGAGAPDDPQAGSSSNAQLAMNAAADSSSKAPADLNARRSGIAENGGEESGDDRKFRMPCDDVKGMNLCGGADGKDELRKWRMPCDPVPGISDCDADGSRASDGEKDGIHTDTDEDERGVRVIVGVQPGVPESEARLLLSSYGFVTDELVTSELWQYGMIVGYLETLNDAGEHPLVAESASHFRYVARDPKSDPLGKIEGLGDAQAGPMLDGTEDWAARWIQAPEVWAAKGGNTGKDVRVAVVDTGVFPNHVLLRGRVREGTTFTHRYWWTLEGDDHPWTDAEGHGTAMAGLIAAAPSSTGLVLGVAPGAIIVPVKVSIHGTGFASAALSGISWAANPKKGNCAVISVSLSWRALAAGGEHKFTEKFWRDAEVAMAIVKETAIVVASAGNQNTDQKRWPADSLHAISVGATGFRDRKRWDFGPGDEGSNFGIQSTTHPYNPNRWVSVSAPGYKVWSTAALKFGQNPYKDRIMRKTGGTSAATALVSGTVALMVHSGRFTTTDVVRSRLRMTGASTVGEVVEGVIRDIGPEVDARKAVLGE